MFKWPDITPAAWSAVAATCSVFCSAMMLWINRRNFIESVKPQVLFDGWEMVPEQNSKWQAEIIKIRKLRNVGKGPALFGWINQRFDEHPGFGMTTRSVPYIPPNGEIELNLEAQVVWDFIKEREPGSGVKMIAPAIDIWVWDSHGRRHDARFQLLIHSHETIVVACHPLAERLWLVNHRITSSAGWWLKWDARFSSWYDKAKRRLTPKKIKP